MPVGAVRIEAGLGADTDFSVALAQYVLAAGGVALEEGDFGSFDLAGLQEHPVAGHSDQITFKAREVIEEYFNCLALSGRPTPCDAFAPDADLVAGSGADCIWWCFGH
jgi:hypothetical protein